MYRIIEALTKSENEPFFHKVIVDDNDNFVLKTYDTVTVNICLEALERAANTGSATDTKNNSRVTQGAKAHIAETATS